MAVARVVTFEDVDPDHLAQQVADIESGGVSEELPATEILVLHCQIRCEPTVAILFFEPGRLRPGARGPGCDGLQRARSGRRTSVAKYTVATRHTLRAGRSDCDAAPERPLLERPTFRSGQTGQKSGTISASPRGSSTSARR